MYKTAKPTVELYIDTETYKSTYEAYKKGERVETHIYGVGAEGRIEGSEDGQKKAWIGLNSVDEFLDFLEDTFPFSHVVMWAYNMPYDLLVLKNYLPRRNTNEVKTGIANINLSDDRAIILNGYLKARGTTIYPRCLWVFKKDMSLSSGYKELTQKGKKAINTTFFEDGKERTKTLLDKGSIDYDKYDMQEEENGDLTYYCPAEGIRKKLDIEAEKDYLENDILIMPYIKQRQEEIKLQIAELARIYGQEQGLSEEGIETIMKNLLESEHGQKLTDRLTVPSVAKAVCSAVMGIDFDTVYRELLIEEDHEFARACRYSVQGGYTCQNIDEKVVTEEVESYDVNSMYPFVMSLGMPTGYPGTFPNVESVPKDGGKPLSYEKDKNGKYQLTGDYVVWREVYGTDEKPTISHKKEIIGEGKKVKLPNFNNTLLVESWVKNAGRTMSRNIRNYLYIHDALWQHFDLTHDHNLKVESYVKVQKLDKRIVPFLDLCYRIKGNKEKYGELMSQIAKLAMNSLYGKTLEKPHTKQIRIGEIKKKVKTKEYKTLVDGDVASCTEITENETENRMLLAGCYVTNTAKTIIHKNKIEEIARGNTFLYCDTDSIKLINRNGVNFDVHPTELGKFKLEKTYSRGMVTGKNKQYFALIKGAENDIDVSMYNNDIKFGGLSRVVLDDFKTNVNYLKAVYSPDNNVLYINGKVVNKEDKTTFTPVICNGDFMGNNRAKPTHISWKCTKTHKGIMEPYSDELLKSFDKKLVTKKVGGETIGKTEWLNM